MPSWLAVDSRHGLISGVPQKQDLGTHTFTVTAHGNTRGLTATDSFTIEVCLHFIFNIVTHIYVIGNIKEAITSKLEFCSCFVLEIILQRSV